MAKSFLAFDINLFFRLLKSKQSLWLYKQRFCFTAKGFVFRNRVSVLRFLQHIPFFFLCSVIFFVLYFS